MFNLVGEVLQSADGNGFFWGILRWAIRLGEIWNHHLCIAFGTKSSRLQKGQSIKYTSSVLKIKFIWIPFISKSVLCTRFSRHGMFVTLTCYFQRNLFLVFFSDQKSQTYRVEFYVAIFIQYNNSHDLETHTDRL